MGDLLGFLVFILLSLSKSHSSNDLYQSGATYFFAHVSNEVKVQGAQTQTIATFARPSSPTPTTSHGRQKKKKNDRAGNLVKLLLEEALTRQRIEMMENFTVSHWMVRIYKDKSPYLY